MDLHLKISRDRLTGTGGDDVGPFLVSGRVHEDRQANWVKTYPGSHDVLYSGFADHNGIWGTWKIPGQTHGGFRIWPASWGEGKAIELQEEAPVEEEAPVADAVPVEVRRGI